MKAFIPKIVLFTQMIFTITAGFAQEKKMDDSTGSKTDEIVNLITADSLKSGNIQNVMTSFFQLSLNDLIGPNKVVNLNSNIYAILLKTNSKLAIDSNFTKYKIYRRFNFSFGLKLDSNYKFNGLSSGLKFAIIDQRDSMTSRWLLQTSLAMHSDITILNQKLLQYSKKTFNNTNDPFLKNIDALLNSKTAAFNSMDPDFQKIVMKIATENHLNMFLNLVRDNPALILNNQLQQSSDSLKNILKNKWLWTGTVSDTTYAHQFKFADIVFATQVLKGVINPLRRINLEIDAKASYNFVDDTLNTGTNLNRNVLYFEPGLNMVVKNNNHEPFFEFKLSGSYYHVFAGRYISESKDYFTFNGTINIRVVNDIWIPVELQYNPKNGNFFGFLNVTANFNGLGSALKSIMAKK